MLARQDRDEVVVWINSTCTLEWMLLMGADIDTAAFIHSVTATVVLQKYDPIASCIIAYLQVRYSVQQKHPTRLGSYQIRYKAAQALRQSAHITSTAV